MIPALVLFSNGTTAYATSYNSSSQLTVTPSQTVSTQSAILYYGGVIQNSLGYLNASTNITTPLANISTLNSSTGTISTLNSTSATIPTINTTNLTASNNIHSQNLLNVDGQAFLNSDVYIYGSLNIPIGPVNICNSYSLPTNAPTIQPSVIQYYNGTASWAYQGPYQLDMYTSSQQTFQNGVQNTVYFDSSTYHTNGQAPPITYNSNTGQFTSSYGGQLAVQIVFGTGALRQGSAGSGISYTNTWFKFTNNSYNRTYGASNLILDEATSGYISCSATFTMQSGSFFSVQLQNYTGNSLTLTIGYPFSTSNTDNDLSANTHIDLLCWPIA
jgi:hypothetical protein